MMDTTQAFQAAVTVLGTASLAVACGFLFLRSRLNKADPVPRTQGRPVDLPLRVIEALMPAMDAAEGANPENQGRARILALETGRAMGLAGEDLQVLKAAALLHDTGTMASLETLLEPSGALMEALRARNEKFDGAGDGIPLAARILAAVIRFDDLTRHHSPGEASCAGEAIARIRREAGTRFDPRVIEVLARIAGRMEPMFSRPQLQEDTLTDPLTRLPNARFLFASFESELARNGSRNGPFSIIELDINDFGAINDAHGHPAGDRILRGVARAIRGQMRECDTCVRYAGDEFIVTLPGVGREGIEAVQGRITQAIESHKFAVARARPLRVTVSMASATFPEDGASLESVLAVADARLYALKSADRPPSADGGGYQRFSGRRDVPVN